MGEVIFLTKGTPKEILEAWLEEEGIEEIMVIGKRRAGLDGSPEHKWSSSNMADMLWWIGMLAHAQAELNLEAVMGPGDCSCNS